MEEESQIIEYSSKMKTFLPDKRGYIYLIRPYAFRMANINIMKIGKTSSYDTRFHSYDKFSEVYSIYLVEQMDEVEKMLLYIFKGLYHQERKHGIEYFQGDPINMISTIEYYISRDFLVHKVNLYQELIHNKLNRIIIFNSYDINPNVYSYIQEVMKKKDTKIHILDILNYNDFYYENIMEIKHSASIYEEYQNTIQPYSIKKYTFEEIDFKKDEIESTNSEEIKSEDEYEDKEEHKEEIQSIGIKTCELKINIYNNLSEELTQTPVNKINNTLMSVLHICHYCIDYSTKHRKDMLKHFERKNRCQKQNEISYEDAKQLTISKKFYFYIDFNEITKKDIIFILNTTNKKINYIDDNYLNQIYKIYEIKENEDKKMIKMLSDPIHTKYYNSETGMYECNLCNTSYTSKQNMKNHINNRQKCEERKALLNNIVSMK